MRYVPILLLVFVLVISGCVQQYQEKETVKIGSVIPLTGNRAEGGSFIKNGIDLAVAEINNDSSRKYAINIIFEDGQYKPDVGVTAIQKLINLDNVKFVIGELSSTVTLAMAPIAEQNKVILITPGSQSEKITTAGDYIFRTQMNTAQEAPFLADYLADRTNVTVHLMGINTDALQSFLSTFKTEYEKRGGKMGIVEKYEITDADFRTQLLKLQQANATYVILLSIPKSTGLILKQAKELGLNITFFGTTAVEGQELLTAGGNAVDGLLYSYPYDETSEDSAMKSFREKYFAVYGKKNEVLAANAYDTVRILSICFESIGTGVDAVKDCLYDTKGYKGASGEITFDENGDVSKPFIVKTVRNGTFVKYEG